MESVSIYSRSGDAVTMVAPDATAPELYRDLLFVRRFNDVFGHVPADEDRVVRTSGEVFYSTNGAYEPWSVRNQMIGQGDMINGCWRPDPKNAVPEYVGARFTEPLKVTGFQFACSVSDERIYCPCGSGPCANPTSFTLEGSNDEANWTTLLDIKDFTGMRMVYDSPYDDEDCSWWDPAVFLSDRMDIPDSHYFLAYRMVISDFKPDIYGTYLVSELVLYGTF